MAASGRSEQEVAVVTASGLLRGKSVSRLRMAMRALTRQHGAGPSVTVIHRHPTPS